MTQRMIVIFCQMSLSQSESTILHESIKFQNDYFEPLIENEYLIVLDLNWHIKLLYYNFLWQTLFCTRFTILTHLTIIRAHPPPIFFIHILKLLLSMYSWYMFAKYENFCWKLYHIVAWEPNCSITKDMILRKLASKFETLFFYA